MANDKRPLTPLTDKTIKSLKPREKTWIRAAGGEGARGLYLSISPTGAKSWILRLAIGPERTRIDKKTGKVTKYRLRREMGLGGYPDVTLAQARDRAREARRMKEDGIDPIKAKRSEAATAEAKQKTFKEATRECLSWISEEFKNAKHAAQWESTLITYAFPVIGDMPVDAVEWEHIYEILKPIWKTKTETATRVRGRIEVVLDHAIGGDTYANPARWGGSLAKKLRKPNKKVKPHPALPWKEINPFVQALRQRDGTAARALEFLILTAVRSGEVRGALWDEIDMDAKTWTIPAERMKAGEEHTVPLCDDAIAILESLPRFEDNNLIFPGPRGGVLSDVGLTKPIRAMGHKETVHGFRSTFRDWCAESTNYPREVAEHALAHKLKDKTEAAYQRGKLLAKRTRLMDDWCKFINTPIQAGEVVPMRKAMS